MLPACSPTTTCFASRTRLGFMGIGTPQSPLSLQTTTNPTDSGSAKQRADLEGVAARGLLRHVVGQPGEDARAATRRTRATAKTLNRAPQARVPRRS